MSSARGPVGSGYVHGHAEAVLRAHRLRDVDNSAAYLRPHLADGQVVLDVGCGPGTITADLANRFPGSTVVGIDPNSDLIAALQAETLPPNLRFAVGDVHALDLDALGLPGGADVVHAHQVLQHLQDPVAALRAMAGACREDGVVAVRDADYAAMTWTPALHGLAAWRDGYRRAAREMGTEPDAGRHLLGWALAAGLERVTASASVWCYATTETRAQWAELWVDRIGAPTSRLHGLLTARPGGDAQVRSMQADWRRWAADPAGWFVVVHGELLIFP